MWTSLPARSFIALAILSGLAPARISWLMTTLPSARLTRLTIASQAPLACPGAPPQSCSSRSSAARKWNMSERLPRGLGTVTPWRASDAALSSSRSWR